MEKRINNGTAGLMIGVAIFIDVIQAILALVAIGLVINRVIAFFAWIIFWFWFKTKNVKLLGNNKKRITTIGGVVAEIIPVIGALPALTLAIVRHIAISRLEDKTGVNFASIKNPANVVNISRARKERERAGLSDNIVTPSRIQRGRRDLRKAA